MPQYFLSSMLLIFNVIDTYAKSEVYFSAGFSQLTKSTIHFSRGIQSKLLAKRSL
jgi:hypothetical protein